MPPKKSTGSSGKPGVRRPPARRAYSGGISRLPSARTPSARSPQPRKPDVSSLLNMAGKKKRKNTAASRPFWIVIVLLAIFALAYQYLMGGGFTNPLTAEREPKIPLPAGEEIRVYFLDVGQGDSVLIQTDENAVLIDAGEYSARTAVLSYLRDAGVTTLDYLIATHPHEDHIGGMVPVLKNFDVKNVVMTDATAGTDTYENFLAQIEEQEVPVTFPSPGDVITAGAIELSVLAPLDDFGENASLVLRMLYGDTAFLFTGDAEANSERDMLEAGSDVRANILKAGHHGSDTSSSGEFLDAVQPAAIVISCGKNNSYGHPHDEMIARAEERGIDIYRTDVSGTIIMSTDGTEIGLLS